VAWFCANADHQTHAAGQKLANPWGLRDVHGNVYEWCWDWYGGYPTGSATDYRGAVSGSGRVIRGGGNGMDAAGCRSANRDNAGPDGRGLSWGFRLVRSLS
jgi:formylglycine-generating enzyme required for sulfatase activity